MNNWYYIRAVVIGVLIGIAILVAFQLVASYLTQGKVTLVPKVEYRDKIVYAKCSTPAPSMSPQIIPMTNRIIQRDAASVPRAIQNAVLPTDPVREILPSIPVPDLLDVEFEVKLPY